MGRTLNILLVLVSLASCGGSIEPRAQCDAVVEQRGDGWTFQGVGWADHVVPGGTCMWMTALNANQARTVTTGSAKACEAPNASELTDMVREVQPLGAGNCITRSYCGAADGCIVEWRTGDVCPVPLVEKQYR